LKLSEMSEMSDAPTHWTVQVMYLYPWGVHANMSNRAIRTRVKRGTILL